MEEEDKFVLEPTTDDESQLVGMLFDKITEVYPDWNMPDRSDLAMLMLGVVKQWAHNVEATSQSTRIVIDKTAQ